MSGAQHAALTFSTDDVDIDNKRKDKSNLKYSLAESREPGLDEVVVELSDVWTDDQRLPEVHITHALPEPITH